MLSVDCATFTLLLSAITYLSTMPSDDMHFRYVALIQNFHTSVHKLYARVGNWCLCALRTSATSKVNRQPHSNLCFATEQWTILAKSFSSDHLVHSYVVDKLYK